MTGRRARQGRGAARPDTGHDRPKAELAATVLHASCLAAAGDTEAAAGMFEPAAARCRDLGLTQLLLDAGWRTQDVLALVDG